MQGKSGVHRVTSRCGFSFLHAHVNDSSIVFEANKLLRTIDDYNYAVLDGHVMSATVTSPFPEGRWFPVNCDSSSATSVVPSATRPPFLFPFYPQERSWGTRETRNHSILIDLRHSWSMCGIEWRSCGAKVAFLCDCVILLTLHGTYIQKCI